MKGLLDRHQSLSHAAHAAVVHRSPVFNNPAYAIAMCSESYLPRISGVVHSLEALTGGLRERGHHVVIAAPRYSGYADRDADVIRFPSVRPPHRPDFPLAVPLAPAAWARLAAMEYDLVHTHGPFLMGSVAARLARVKRIPLVFTHHTLYDEYVHYAPWLPPQLSAPAVRRYVTAYANRCSCVIVPSHAVEQRLRAHGVHARMAVIPTALLEPEVFGPRERTSIRAAYGIAPGRALLVTAGRLAKEKSLDLVIEAAAKIMAQIPATLMVIGGGPEEEALRDLAERLGIGNAVVFTGLVPHDRALDCLAAGDLFVHASQTETQGLVVIEAMAVGLPVVAVDAGGVADAVRDGITGYLVPAQADALAAKAAALLHEPVLRASMARAAREAAEAYRLSVILQQLIDLYDSLVPVRRGQGARE